MAHGLRDAAHRALLDDGRPEEAITVNQRALIDKILARYSAEFTVFRELLQNADDAGATECELRFATSATVPHALLPAHMPSAEKRAPDVTAPLTQWTFRNNGKPFSNDDWNRLRRIAEGNPDPERIGAFGVGFYSLFSICEEPIVSSGNELMGFFWKGDALFTRRAQSPQTDVSSTGMPWTTFLMALREPTPFPESPLALCQFLATSLTFTTGVRRIALYLDDQLLCRLSKEVDSPQAVSPSRHLNGTSPGRMLRVQTMQSTALHVQLHVARLVLLEAAAEAEKERPSLKKSLVSAFSKSAGAGLTSMLASALGNFSAKPSAAPSETAMDVDALLELVPAQLHLSLISAYAGVSADSAFLREIERSTKKQLPKTTPLHMVFMGKDELEASSVPPPESAYTEIDEHVRRLFFGLMPSLDAQGRVFIGFRTHQTTSFSGHMAARFIPTVERESLDFVDRYCARWNMELLGIGGYIARVAYEAEMQRIGARWAAQVDRASGEEKARSREHLLACALHAMRFFSFHASSPSKRVSAALEDAFFACCSRPCISLISTQGVRASDAVRFPSAMLAEFVKELPVLPAEHLESAETFVTQLRARNMVQDITLDDVFGELGSRALSVDEMVACLRWWLMVAEHPSYDAALRNKLVRGAMVSIPNGDNEPRIQALSDVQTVLQPQKVPASVPLPPSCLVYEVSRQLRTQDLITVFGWDELTVAAWLDYMVSLDASPAPAVVAEHGLTQSPANAEKVFGTLSWAWGNLPTYQRDHIVKVLTPLRCIPTRLGMKRPNEAYFSSVSLFGDLPVLAFPSLMVKGNLEKLLLALHVRKHVEIQLIFDRLISAGDWSHVDLVGYLAKHRDMLSVNEMERLTSTAIFPVEGDQTGKRLRAADVYEPLDELRALRLPVLDWQGKSWRSSSDEARLITALGLRRHPPLSELLRLASSANEDTQLRPIALQYLLSKFTSVYSATYSLRTADAVAFVPTTAGTLLPPSQVYTDAAAATMGFAVAVLPPLDAVKLQLRAHPASEMLTQRLMASPPEDEDTARRIFVFLSSCRDLATSDIRKLRSARIIPVRRGSAYVHMAPRDCYFLPESSQSIAPEYREVFDYIDFGPSAATFLRACGVSDEPSVDEVVQKLVADAPRFYKLCGSTEAYLGVLRRISEKLPSLSSETLYTVKRTPILLGLKKVPGAGDDDDATQEYALRRPSEVVIVDDAHAHMLFGEHLYAAPPDDALETQLYAPLGAPYLSSLIDESYAVSNDVRRDTPRAKAVHATILERTPLFLFEKRASGRKEIQREFDWLKDALVVVDVGGQGVQLTRTLRHGQTSAKDVQQCSAMAVMQRKALVLHLAAGLDVDWFEVALALTKFLLTKQQLQEVLLLMTVLSTPLRSLKRKGFNVDKMLAQQRPAPSAPVKEEALDVKACVAELLQMFPAADPAYLAKLVQSFPSEHMERASEVLLENKYPRRHVEPEKPRLPPHDAFDAFEDAMGAPPEKGLVPRAPEPAPAPPVPEKGLGMVPTRPGGPMPPLDVGALQGANGGLFQHWKNKFTGNKLSSLANGSSSIQRAPQGPLTQPPRDDQPIAPASNIRQHVQQAIQASRPDGSRVIQSQAETREVRQAASSYCDVSGITTDLRLAGQVAGMNVYASVELDPAKMLEHNAGALERLIQHVYGPIGAIFQVDPRALNVFCDTKGPSIAFNRGGSLFLNLRYYLAWHDEDVRAGRLATPLISVYFSVAHELAHNLVADHNSEHEFYFSSIAEEHFLGLAKYIAQLG